MSKGFGSVQKSPTSKATAMNGKRKKEKVKRHGKRGRLRRYDPLDFSLFTGSENAAGGFFQQTLAGSLQQGTLGGLHDDAYSGQSEY
jgi:hypothetical protein